MDTRTKKRYNFIINTLYLAIVVSIVYLFFKYLFWATSPFVISFFGAVCLQRPLRWLDKKTNKKCHTLWSILLVVLCLLVILVPLSLILWKIGTQIAEFFNYIASLFTDIPTLLDDTKTSLLKAISSLPDGIENTLASKINSVFTSLSGDFDLSKFNIDIGSVTSKVTSGITTGISGVYGFVKNVPSIALALVIGIIAWIFFTKDYSYIVRFISKQLPNNKKNLLVEIKSIFSTTVLKMFKAYGIIMFITFCELSLGFSILKAIGLLDTNYVFVIAIVIAIFDILPVAGSGGILIPWALINVVLGNFKLALGIFIIYVIILVIRQYIEPKIVGDTLGVHPIITLAGLYFGLKLFGFMGMFIVPICVMTLKAFNDTGRIHIWKTIERK